MVMVAFELDGALKFQVALPLKCAVLPSTASVLAEHQQRLIDWQAKEKQILSTRQ